MQINKDDFETVYTADALYDGPEGQLWEGDKFRIIPSGAGIDNDLVVVKVFDIPGTTEDLIMSFRHKNGEIVSD